MASVAAYYAGGTASPNFGATLANEVWQANVEAAVYEDGIFFPLMRERDRLYNKLHIRKIDRFSAQTLTYGAGTTQDGQGLTYGAATDTEITVSPVGNYVAVALSKNQIMQMNVDMTAEFKQSVEEALAQNIDQYAHTNCSAALTTNVLGDNTSSIDRALFLNLQATVRKNARVAFQPGHSPIKFIFAPTQIPAVMSIPEITAANLRGDSQDPNVRGIVLTALGTEFFVSGNVASDASGYHNPMFVESAFAISWNERPSVMQQTFELQERIIGYCNYGVKTVWDDRAGDLRTKTTI